MAGRDESSKFWKGLVNRWNKALSFAMDFLPEAEAVAAITVSASFPPFEPDPPQAASAVMVRALRQGSEGDLVRAWQSFLLRSDYSVGELDGIFGDKTFAATRAFQEKNGLVPPGPHPALRRGVLKAPPRPLTLAILGLFGLLTGLPKIYGGLKTFAGSRRS